MKKTKRAEITANNLKRLMQKAGLGVPDLIEKYGSEFVRQHLSSHRAIGPHAGEKYIEIFKDAGLLVSYLDFLKEPSAWEEIKIPLIAYVSAEEPFQMIDEDGFGSGLEMLDLPPAGINPKWAKKVYAVQVKGNSMRPLLNDGAILFIKAESKEEIRHNDIVIFKDEEHNAWVKIVLFYEDKYIFRSINHEIPDIVKKRSDMILMERVIVIVPPGGMNEVY